ncbi:MAG: hypothetical protein HYZ53_13060 [Planctomycetes bacterium]|nr:hypothetical protein [Planctomycetota bacterium]
MATLPDTMAARLRGLEALDRDEVLELRSMTAEQSIALLEELLAAGFALIDEALEEERRTSGDVEKLARFLLDGEAR